MAVLLVGHRLRGGAIDADFAKNGTVGEQLAPKQKCESSCNGNIYTIFDIRENCYEDTREEDDNLQRRRFPKLENNVGWSNEISDSVDDDGSESG